MVKIWLFDRGKQILVLFSGIECDDSYCLFLFISSTAQSSTHANVINKPKTIARTAPTAIGMPQMNSYPI
jgi:hypothetical protein